MGKEVWLQEYECVYEGCYRFHLERLDGTFAAFNWKQSYRDMSRAAILRVEACFEFGNVDW